MPVQWINRPNAEFRGACGRIAQGRIRPKDPVRILPSGVETRVKEVLAWGGPQGGAEIGDSITLTFEDEVDVSRGDLLTSPRMRRKWRINSRRISYGCRSTPWWRGGLTS